jgi:hypothetical protein
MEEQGIGMMQKDESNPYEVRASSQIDSFAHRVNPFWIGLRNGFLWSLLVAVPASSVFYSELLLGMANVTDPVTLKRTQVPLTASHRMTAGFQSAFTALLSICLPWATVAGLVKLAHSKKVTSADHGANGNHGNEG